MSQIPSDSGTDNDRRRSLTYDELIALFVAFLTLGSVLFWGLTRSGVNLFDNVGLFDADGSLAIVGDGESQLDLSEELAISELDANDEIGFGTAEAIGATDGFLGDVGRSVQQATDQIASPGTSRSANVPAIGTTTPSGLPELPKQTAQPATPSEETPAEDADNIQPNLEALPPLEASREALQFQDVPADYWAKPYIDALSERLVISGLTEDTFAPEEPVTRAQLASAIAEAFPLDGTKAEISFSDINADYWATQAINKAVKLGFMSGFPDQTFQPALPVPRAQALTALVTGLNSGVPENSEAIVERYSDASEIPSWAVGKMAAATQSEIVVNYPNLTLLNPNQPATRAEVAAMIYQTLVAQGRIDQIDGEYVVRP
ncbi:MAG: hypothetical protein F6K31_33690 [Symploca sp. SIO2G7]|nr:hypothetical protein [Symploca sp. SIO2G7]